MNYYAALFNILFLASSYSFFNLITKSEVDKISFTAFDMAIYGQVDGIVTKVAANTTSNEDGLIYYPTVIEVIDDSIKNNQGIIIQSGMQCDVSIIGEERTVLSYIANPITKLSMTALQE